MESKTHRILRMILYLSNSYSKTKEECNEFLGIRDSAFYNYRNTLIDTGFDLQQKDGRYWINYNDQDHQVLKNVLHFSEEETYILSRAIDLIEEKPASSLRLKQKLASFLNQDRVIETYIEKEKSELVHILHKARKEKKQALLINYSSGNSLTVKNRLVEPFEFKDDFNLVWAFDTELNQNRQFKVCRMENIEETPISWEHERLHRSKPVDIFRNTGDLNKEVELVLNLKARNLLIEEYPISDRYISKIKSNQFILKALVTKYEGPARFVMGLMDDIQIIGDHGFADFVKEKMKNFHNSFSSFGKRGV